MKFKVFLIFVFALCSSYSFAQHVIDMNSAMQKADLSFDKKNYEEALKIYLDVAYRISKKDGLYVEARLGAARCYENLKMCGNAASTAEGLLKLNLSDAGREEVKKILFNNAFLQADSILEDNIKNFLEARAVYEKIKPYASGSDVDKLNDALQNTYIIQGRREISDINLEKALESFKTAYKMSNNSQQRIDILYNIASINENIGSIGLSIDCYDEARRIASEVGDDLSNYLALKYERNIYRNLNDMENFTSLGLTMDSLMSNVESPYLLSDYYDYIGNEYVDRGNYCAAEFYFQRIPELIKKAETEDLRTTISMCYYSNMRDLRRKQNNYKSAIEYNTKLASCYSKIYDTSNVVRYLSYLVDTQLYSEMKDSLNFERSADSLRSAYDMIPDAFNKALVYNFIGSGYSKLGNSNKALSCYEKADSVLSVRYEQTFDLRMTMLELRAGELKKIGRSEEACRLYKHSMDLVEDTYGRKSQQYSRAEYLYANSLRADGRMEESAEYYCKSIEILENILKKQLRYVTATDRESFINMFSQRLWAMLSFASDYSGIDQNFVKLCYNTTIKLKSLLFESDRSMYNTLQLKGTAEDISDFNKMSSLRMHRKFLFKDFEKNKNKIDSIGYQIRNIDNRLTAKSKLYSEYTSFLNFKYEDLCSNLGKKDVLFDFFDYKEPDGLHKYIAYVVRKDSKCPIVVDMFSENDVDSLLQGDDIDVLYNNDRCTAAINMLWSRLEKYAEKGAKVYYVPSGVLYQVSLESLPLSDGSLLGEQYKFVRLSSALRIADVSKPFDGKKNAVLYGGLKYDMDMTDMLNESIKFDHKKLYSMRSMAGGEMKFAYLPQTLHETEQIGTILREHGYDVISYTEGEGTEESFLNMHNNSPQILHIATHGFYYTPDEASRSDFLKGSTDAMFLSGLVLSGGNAAWLGKDLPNGVMGGIISAGNISCLDLSNVQLAVLSACQSGQGKVTREGLFGLQRAFKKAGVKSIVMTLWNVSDVVTGEFMVEFYKNLFKGKHSVSDQRKAFMKAKRYIREKYPEPLYWAGFVMVD